MSTSRLKRKQRNENTPISRGALLPVLDEEQHVPANKKPRKGEKEKEKGEEGGGNLYRLAKKMFRMALPLRPLSLAKQAE